MSGVGRRSALVVLLALLPGVTAAASTRTLESPFALSADPRSEFSTAFRVFSPGRIVIEASWAAPGGAAPPPLRFTLIRPDGSEAARKDGLSPLRLEYPASDTEVERLNVRGGGKWRARVINDIAPSRHEVSGKLRVTVPTTGRALEDTQFTLLGGGNAQEIPARIPAPGRVLVEAEWETDPLAAQAAPQPVPLTLSLIHPGLDKIYARRVGKSLLRIEQQISEADLEKGNRLIVRLQNDNTVKVKGRVKVIFVPSL